MEATAGVTQRTGRIGGLTVARFGLFLSGLGALGGLVIIGLLSFTNVSPPASLLIGQGACVVSGFVVTVGARAKAEHCLRDAVPGITFVCVWCAAFYIAASADPNFEGASDFFTTAAQVLAGILIGLVIEGRDPSPNPVATRYRAQGLRFIGLGLGSSLAALMPMFDDRWLIDFLAFPLVAGALSAALVAVVLVAGKTGEG